MREYHYYLCGLNIGGIDYTVRMVEAEEKDGNRYYDHKLTHIEKGKLINELAFHKSSPTGSSSTLGSGVANQYRPTDGGEIQRTPISVGKYKRLFSILQINSSKVVDENGEPMVVFHGTENGGFTIFDSEKGKGQGFSTSLNFFSTSKKVADGYSISKINFKDEVADGTPSNYDEEKGALEQFEVPSYNSPLFKKKG